MQNDDWDGAAAARDLSFTEAVERMRPRFEQVQVAITAIGDQLLAAAAEIARWWEQARSPYLGSYEDLDDHARGLVDALEEVLRTQRELPGATDEEAV